MSEHLSKKARTFMPEIMYPGTGLSPSTQRSVIPTNNVTTIQDVLEGHQYKLPGMGGAWGDGEDAQSSYKDDGNDYKREDRDLEILKKMSVPVNVPREEWTVRTEGGSRAFESLQQAQDFKKKLEQAGFKVRWMSRTRTASSNMKTAQDSSRKIDIVNLALEKTYKVVVRRSDSSIESNGAAFCVEDGKFLTCAHVIQKYDKNANEKINLFQLDQSTTIFLSNGPKKYQARVVAVDEVNDIALLECDVRMAPFGFQTQARIGDDVIAVGSPHGFENNVSFGHITSLNKKIYTHKGAPNYMFIDANVFAGNSGGPIINVTTGMVVGMVTAIAAASGEYGLNAGLPTIYLERFCAANGVSMR